MKEQTALDIARRMAELGEHGHAVTAYTLALADAQDCQPDTELEAALYILEHGGNYKVAYDAFQSLYSRGLSAGNSAGADDPGILHAQSEVAEKPI